MKPQLRTTLLAFAAILLLATACKKKNESASSSGPGAVAFSDLLVHLPKDSSIVMGFSPSNLSSSSLFKEASDEMIAEAIPGAAEMKAKCGLNLMTDLTSVVVAASAFDESEKIVMAVTGDFDQKKIETCITTMGGTVNGSSYLVTGKGDPMNAYWPSSNILLLSKLSVDELTNLEKGANLKQNPVMMAVVDKVDLSSSIWAAGEVPSELAEMGQGMFAAPQRAYLSIKLSSAINLRLGADFASESDAQGAESMLGLALAQGKTLMPAAQAIIDTVKIEQAGANLSITAKVTEEALKSVAEASGLPL